VDKAVLVALIASATSLGGAAWSVWFQRQTAREAREQQLRSDAKVVRDKYRYHVLSEEALSSHRLRLVQWARSDW
jgi:hypothetical protein